MISLVISRVAPLWICLSRGSALAAEWVQQLLLPSCAPGVYPQGWHSPEEQHRLPSPCATPHPSFPEGQLGQAGATGWGFLAAPRKPLGISPGTAKFILGKEKGLLGLKQSWLGGWAEKSAQQCSAAAAAAFPLSPFISVVLRLSLNKTSLFFFLFKYKLEADLVVLLLESTGTCAVEKVPPRSAGPFASFTETRQVREMLNFHLTCSLHILVLLMSWVVPEQGAGSQFCNSSIPSSAAGSPHVNR